MALLGTGQAYGGIAQTAYVVEDVDAAMTAYVERMRVGPWFVAGPFHPAKPVYRGRPIVPHLTLAFAHTGTMMIELIEQHDDAPSVFAEVARARGYGFHIGGSRSRISTRRSPSISDKATRSPSPTRRRWACASPIWTP